ncbi:MAG TPA: Mur ligase domain-containing protein, partial [Candidatus Competibacteraceae bacterium]|nr:Mur ligase domain-containing protein [Candidatus Competibacteraceae bacterium]
MSGMASLTLGELLAGFAETPVPWAGRPVEGLAADSRTVHPGDVFFAVRGGQRHGLEFLESVRSAGVLAVLWEPPWDGALPAD